MFSEEVDLCTYHFKLTSFFTYFCRININIMESKLLQESMRVISHVFL